jgi:hypothetical protein
MKQRPIVVLGRIRTEVVLDWIRTAVSAKWIRQGTRANGASDKNGRHLIADSPRIGMKSMLFSRAGAAESGFRDGVEEEDGLAERRMTEGMSA